MNKSWHKHQERGNVFAMKLMAWIALIIGRPVARLLLYPICLYFYLFLPRARKASRDFLTRVFQRPPRFSEVFRHFYWFASTILDRSFMYQGYYRNFVLNKYGLEVLRDIADKQGCLFVGSHLGTFDIVRISGTRRWNMVFNIMMYEENARKMQKVVAALNKSSLVRVLPIGSVDSLIRAKERVENGEMLAILADRILSGDKTVEVNFMGGRIELPAGPFLTASTLKIPIILFFPLYMGRNQYEVYFELFSERITLTRGNRDNDLQVYAQKYADRLEHYCRYAPFNWFNYYDYWRPELQTNSAENEDDKSRSQAPVS
jgi:predicted LPLAT superfamily acyltransferase